MKSSLGLLRVNMLAQLFLYILNRSAASGEEHLPGKDLMSFAASAMNAGTASSAYLNVEPPDRWMRVPRMAAGFVAEDIADAVACHLCTTATDVSQYIP